MTSLLPYLLWHFAISFLCRSQDLKKRYNASWALVTGASSGVALSMFLPVVKLDAHHFMGNVTHHESRYRIYTGIHQAL